MTDDLADLSLADKIIKSASKNGVMIATAESCTGGLIVGALTEIAGSSAVVDRGFVTYSNEAKNEMLSVPMALIKEHGAVSAEVARAMAEGAIAHSRAGLSVSVTGIAGPGGGTAEKPVGLVWFGLAGETGDVSVVRHVFEDKGRQFIREKTVETALNLLLSDIAKS